MAQTVKD